MTYVPHTERETQRDARCDRRRAHGGPVRRRPGRRALSGPQASAARRRRSKSCAEMQALAGRNFGVDPSLVLSRRRHLSSLPARDRRLRAAPRRVLHLLHAVPAGGEPGHAAGPVRIPEHDLPAHRHGGQQRQPLRRRHRARRGGPARPQCRAGQAQQDRHVARGPSAVSRGGQDLSARHPCGHRDRRRGRPSRPRSAQSDCSTTRPPRSSSRTPISSASASRSTAWPTPCTAPARC